MQIILNTEKEEATCLLTDRTGTTTETSSHTKR